MTIFHSNRGMDGLSLKVQPDLEALEVCLERLTASRFKKVPEVSRYLIHSGGKRIRPMALFLACRLFQPIHPNRVEVAAAIELLHSATLLHDDIVDQALLRRGRPSSNAMFGSQLTVLVGDYLVALATLVLMKAKSLPLLELVAKAAKGMAEGEVLQFEYQGSTALTQKVYLTLIAKKTALLMGTSTGATAILHSNDPRVFKALKSYGIHLGFAFQIMDDILDYAGSEDGIGKERFKDIKEGKVTLPLLFAISRASKPERQFLEGIVAKREVPQTAERVLLEILDRTEGVTQAKRMAESFVSKAEKNLDVFGSTPAVSDLKLLGRFVLERTY